MNRVDTLLDAITEDRRADYLWATKEAAQAVNLRDTIFSRWWEETRRRLEALAMADPAATAAELTRVLARAASRVQRNKVA